MAKPTIRELLDGLDESCGINGKSDLLAERVEAVLLLHREDKTNETCGGCHKFWPCRTIRALEGEESR